MGISLELSTNMKSSPTISDEFSYAIKEVGNLYRSLIDTDTLLSFDKEKLEECFRATQTRNQNMTGLSRTIPDKSAVLLFELLNNSPLVPKRRQFAVIILLLFLYTRSYSLDIPASEFKSMIMWIELSSPAARKETIKGASKVISKHLQAIDTEI